MTDRQRHTVQTFVNSRAKLDVLYYFHRNPHARESLHGLAQRLHRAPEDLENALRDLTRQDLLDARASRGGGSELIFTYNRGGAETAAIAEVLEAYEGPERREILQTVCAEDEHSALRRAAQQRALDDLRTRFVSMVTHELRTPVTIIKSVLQALRAHGAIEDQQALSLLERAVRQSERLSSIVENLLVLSGLQTGRQLELYLSDVDVERLVDEVCDRFAEEGVRPRLHVSLTDVPPTIVADEYLVGQLLEELINNAIKFSPEHAPVEIAVTQEEGLALFTIEDQGMGVSAHQHERVFDPFFQGQEDAARLTGGMGLGLFMARKIAESHGGHIWLDPKAPPGVRVCFSIPVTGPQE